MDPTTVADILDEAVQSFEGTTPVDDAIDAIRTSTSEAEHTVYYAYVVDDDGALEGVVSLRELLNADADADVCSVATESVVTVSASDTAAEVAKVFAQNKFMALPVVDDGALVGVIRAGDVIEALDETASKEVLRATLRDVEYDPGAESAYECFTCGNIVTAADNPGTCPNCGGDVRHRQTSIE
ncbi:rubrerythrin-like domain-containing protein [Halobiforma nitratireducens]|uniref:CBS/transporter associated domain-containing protein n=1 Tax=Halobiforma nitratireducens JCM 10879 TaxID=1227454 RepID=M0LW04_9EURY|nr:rubrerythrin-like domain-containing protein [Halobiforma nitratireducens]EMA37343.1 CBS/transporter associated domain-containing protein [Halobiforma nitratireducens JCM 10879]